MWHMAPSTSMQAMESNMVAHPSVQTIQLFKTGLLFLRGGKLISILPKIHMQCIAFSFNTCKSNNYLLCTSFNSRQQNDLPKEGIAFLSLNFWGNSWGGNETAPQIPNIFKKERRSPYKIFHLLRHIYFILLTIPWRTVVYFKDSWDRKKKFSLDG